VPSGSMKGGRGVRQGGLSRRSGGRSGMEESGSGQDQNHGCLIAIAMHNGRKITRERECNYGDQTDVAAQYFRR
jgi:hypothetical protein